MKRKLKKPYWEMTTEELAEATKEFDKPIPLSKFRPMSTVERKRWEQAKREPYVSIYAQSRMKWRVTFELHPTLVRRCMVASSTLKLPFGEFVNRSLKSSISLVVRENRRP